MSMKLDLVFPTGQWVDVYARAGITKGLPLLIQSKTIGGDVLVWIGAAPPAATARDGYLLTYKETTEVESGAAGCWAALFTFARPDGVRLSVQVQD